MLIVSDAWRLAYPGAAAGTLAMREVNNPAQHPELERLKSELEQQLRDRFSDLDKAALSALQPIAAYVDYFSRYKKTYHVLLQIESIATKGRSIPRVAALVEAMFMAELKNQLLTAGHDLEAVRPPVRLDVSQGGERYTLLNGKEQVLKLGDMMMVDAEGIISSVIYGPDRRTCLAPQTRRALFAVYAPPGVGEQAVRAHLEDIRAYVRVVAPQATVEALDVYGAAG